jgi:hypothetical protein
MAIDETWYEHHASGYLSFVVFIMPKIEQNSSRVKEVGGRSINGHIYSNCACQQRNYNEATF